MMSAISSMWMGASTLAQVLSLQAVLLILGVIGNVLAYLPAFGFDDWVRRFGVWTDERRQRNDEEARDAARLDAVVSEITRTVVWVVGSTIVIVLFADSVGSLSVLFSRGWFWAVVMVFTAGSLYWVLYHGPRTLARELAREDGFTTYSWRKHLLPYLAFVPNSLTIWTGIGPTMLCIMLLVAGQEIGSAGVVEQLLRPWESLDWAGPTAVTNLTRQAIQLVRFGDETAFRSQKYVIAGLLTLLYLVAEQRTNMQKTLLQGGIDKLKLGVWAVFLVAFVFGAVYLPMEYSRAQNALQEKVALVGKADLDASALKIVMNVQKHLEAHSLKWLMLEVLTGYGNLIALTIAIGTILLRHVFFKGVPLLDVLGLLLPTYAHSAVVRFMGHLGVSEASQETDKKESGVVSHEGS